MHESGSWHFGFDPATFQSLFREGDQPASRFASKWKKQTPSSDALVLAVRIQVPFEAVNIPAPELESKVRWIDAPIEEQMVEIGIFLSGLRIPYADVDVDWRPLQATFVGGFPLDGGGGVWIACRHVPSTYPAHGPVVRRRYGRDVIPEMVMEELETLRFLVWGDCEDGSIGLFESPTPLESMEFISHE